LQLAIQAQPLDGNCDRIDQRPQDQQIIRMKCPRRRIAHPAHQDLAFNFKGRTASDWVSGRISRNRKRAPWKFIRDGLFAGLSH